MTFAPAIARPWRDAWPLVAQTDDGNQWVTGACWLYCRREGVRVLWVGSVTTPAQPVTYTRAAHASRSLTT